jgi:DNA polymerase III gamma/tau subunit
LRALLLTQTASADLVPVSDEERKLYNEQARRISRSLLLRAIRAFNDAVSSYRGGWQPQLSLELALVESIRGGDEDTMARTQHAAPLQSGMPAYAAQAGMSQAEIAALVRQILREQSGSGGAEKSSAPPLPESTPGAPPVIEAEKIRQQWVEIQRVADRYNRSVPAMLEHARVVAVDGNQVIIGAENENFYTLLTRQAVIGTIEKAFHEVFKMVLRIKVVVGANQAAGSNDAARQNIIENDPLARMAVEELDAEIRHEDSP